MALNEVAWSGGFRRVLGDESLGATLALVLDSATKQLHICDAADSATDWTLSADSYPSVYVHDIAAPATDYVKIYHNGTNGIIDCDGTTIFAMTATTLAITADITVTGDIDLGTEDISVAQGKYIYLDGQDGSEHIRSAAVGKITITASGTGTDDITLAGTVTVNDVLTCGSYLDIFGTTGSSTTAGQIWYNTTYKTLRWYNGTEQRQILDATGAGVVTFVNTVTMSEAYKLYFRDTGIYIYSQANARLSLVCDGTSVEAITLTTGAGGSVYINAETRCGSYLNLFGTTSASSLIGRVWYDSTYKTIRWYNGTEQRQVLDATGAGVVTFNNTVTMAEGYQLYFRNSATYIYSPAGNKLSIVSTGTNIEAIRLTVGSGGAIYLDGPLKLFGSTSGIATEGMLWLNSTYKTLRYYTGSAEKSVLYIPNTGWPTADPTVEGELWNNSGVVTVSAG